MNEETMTYYEATSYSGIQELKVVKETDRLVFLPNGRKRSKDGEFSFIRKTRGEAKEALIKHQQNICYEEKLKYEKEQEILMKMMEL